MANRYVTGGLVTWPDEWSEKLVELWPLPMSAKEIAEAIAPGELTKNAIIGRANRMGLPPKVRVPAKVKPVPPPRAEKKPRKPPAPPKERPSMMRRRVVAPAVQFGPPPPPPNIKTAKIILLRGAGECAWPMFGERADTLFCCAPTAGDSSYCPCHLKLTVRQGKKLRPYQFTGDHEIAQAGNVEAA